MLRLYLGVDIGSSALKLCLLNEKKELLAQHSENYACEHLSSGWSEIDPERWVQAFFDGLEALLEGVPRAALTAIGVTGQMHTLVVLDEQGKPARRAIMWNDMRTKEVLPEMRARIARFAEPEPYLSLLSTGSPASGLYWIRKYEPEVFARVRRFLIAPDYLVYRLTGRCSTDYCEASTSSLFNPARRTWSEEMRALVGYAAEVFPEVRGSAQTAGVLKRSIASRFGLPDQVRVIVGTGDNVAAALASGCLGQRFPLISLGTSGVLMMPVAEGETTRKGKRILFSAEGEQFHNLVQGVVQSTGNTLDWWGKSILQLERFAEIEARIDPEEVASSELLFYPHILGEKTLYADPDLRGAFLNLGIRTGREALFASVIEGICMSFRELLDKMELPIRDGQPIKVIGGGSKSDLWLQLLANILDRPIERCKGSVGPAVGIALLAAYGAGSFASLQEMSAGTLQVTRRFVPMRELHGRIEQKYARYRRVYEALKSIGER